MPDREKVLNGLEACRKTDCINCPYSALEKEVCLIKYLLTDALALLKEQEEREKAICKEICNFIRGSCSTDTYSDKEYVCHVVQQIFIKERRS